MSPELGSKRSMFFCSWLRLYTPTLQLVAKKAQQNAVMSLGSFGRNV